MQKRYYKVKNDEFKIFLSNYIENSQKIMDKPKASFFLDYLRSTYGRKSLETPDAFSAIDKDVLLNSIEAYINDKWPVKGVAEDYRRTIIELCEAVCKEYDIENAFLESASEQKDFYEITKDWFEHLKQSESRECMSSEEVEKIDEAIRLFFNTANLEDQIRKSIENKKIQNNYYRQLVSAISVKLVQKYALANATIPNLKITDLNIEERTLVVNGFKLHLSDELIPYLKLYLKSREWVVKATDSNTDKLFITKNGTAYLTKTGYSQNDKLFALMQDTLGHKEATGLQYRTIVELVSRGANINLLSQLTGVNKETIADICTEDKSTLESIFANVHNPHVIGQRKVRKGQLQCPYCGNYFDASSENWILIQVAGNEKKYLACRECRGLDGKVRY